MFNRLYVHVPFCVKKCHYCAFVSTSPEEAELSEYPVLLLHELQLHTTGNTPLASIYFGGGTPSLLQPQHLSELLDGIKAHTPIREDAEITLEANPGTVDGASLKEFRKAGINRISLGIQSFEDHFLKTLGRIHTVEQSRQAFLDARETGFTNISIDLIHSLPGQSLDQWRSELQHAIELSPEHISIYGLTIEDGTHFARTYVPDSPELVDDDLSADMFELADKLLTAAGFEHYEIANYARPGYRSQHNSGYWSRDGYLGLGVAAHSLLLDGYGVRFSNPDNLLEYRQGILSARPARIDEHKLTLDDAMSEFMFLGLRLSDGVNLRDFERAFGRSLESAYGPATTALEQLGLVVRKDEVLALTLKGMLLSNQVFARFL
ncbi:MAG: radical SAM family heme chaperone HemW [Desulfuromonadaceae bacterium]|nr:radical SAM family heme chaperone HemW [Desulfuromonadaceae bacterium]MDD2849894.1 radical SAM family heme chaperone HemW [Desulfuromonadaceae bacterium]MDD4130709.1 radical SAM family heme chaperone HemW [Desulfuromonadaceae bacterium]